MYFFFPESGELYTFGETDDGKLGLGEDISDSTTPQHVMAVTDRVKSVACGGSHTVVLTGQPLEIMLGDFIKMAKRNLPKEVKQRAVL
jgi:alpha-tubulin suppressor-like RCC1 family protein